jgi:hypothetical protein
LLVIKIKVPVVATGTDETMNDVMADLASDAAIWRYSFYHTLIDDAGEFGQCGSGANNVVGLTPLSHCVLRSITTIPSPV